MGPAVRFETERLHGRAWRPEDGPALRRVLDECGDHLRPWVPWMREEPRSLEATVAWLRAARADFDRDEGYRYALFLAETGDLVGGVSSFRRVGDGAREAGYWIHRAASGQGLAGEATAAVVRVAFELDGVDRVEIRCQPENRPSQVVAERLGFRHEATLRRRSRDSEGRLVDLMIWTLFAVEYPGTPASKVSCRAFGPLDDRLL